jgi:hypothetical protein
MVQPPLLEIAQACGVCRGRSANRDDAMPITSPGSGDG